MSALLEGKTAIITGSGRGIGRAAAEMFALHGAQVVVSDIDPEPAAQAVEAILATGGQAISVPGDATDKAFPDRIVSAAIEKFGGLDIIVNNAGYTWDAVIHKMTDEQWEAILAVHLTAPFRIIRAASTFMRESAKREWAESGQARAAQDRKHQLDFGHARQPGPVELFIGQSRSDRPDPDARQGVGPVQHPGELCRVRPDRHASYSSEGKRRDHSSRRYRGRDRDTAGATRPDGGDDPDGPRRNARRSRRGNLLFRLAVFELRLRPGA